MSGASSAKKLLKKFNSQQYKNFILNQDTTLILPEISSTPGIAASKRKVTYKKTLSHPESAQHIKFITKNDDIHHFVWQTKPQQLKKAVRWGIIKTHSITSKVIAALGQYRVVAHQRIAKGMISSSQAVKLHLLDLFQDRFEALQDLESLVNKKNSIQNYKEKLNAYVHQLEQIKNSLNDYFSTNNNDSGFDQTVLRRIATDIEADIKRVHAYIASLQTENTMPAYTRSRGYHSLMEFMKQQMVYGLYELQGINQDMTYSKQRNFALTRGELNDFIEDARKVIDDHQADPRNAVTAAHHGVFAEDNESLVTYDFSEDHLNPERQREVLLAISFIEEWDKVDHQKLTVSNSSGSESLDMINSPKWKTHRNFTMFIMHLGYYIFNMFKGILFATHPWEEESWANSDFHLIAAELRKNTPANEPMWQKPIQLFKKIGNAIADVFNGVKDFGSKLTIKMPRNILNDWDSTDELPLLSQLLKEAETTFAAIKTEEKRRLDNSLLGCNYNTLNNVSSPANSKLAAVEYSLSAGEQNDILTAMARGLYEFSSIFSHNLFAKDPLAGLVFTGAFAAGAAAIYLPSATASVLGQSYVTWFSNFAYSMGSSKMAATVSAGSTQAQFVSTVWDGLTHGPSGIACNTLYQLGQDPLTIAAYMGTATAIGYLMVNGIGGYSIPWLSELLKEDLGTSPGTSYPFIGAKVAIMLYETLSIEQHRLEQRPELSSELLAKAQSMASLNPEQQRIIDRFVLASWLSVHQEIIPKLDPGVLFILERHVDQLFDKEHSASLKKLIYPEQERSIAFQLVSIPLAYIPALVRLFIAPVLSLFALAYNKPNPLEPMKRTANHLLSITKKDLSRLLVFGTHLIYLAYTGLTTLTKVCTITCTLLIGRVASVFDAKPAHFLYKIMGSCHTFFRTVGEFFYPARILKSVAIAHPTHTMGEIKESYTKLLSQLGDEQEASKGNKTSDEYSAQYPSPLSGNNESANEKALDEDLYSLVNQQSI